MYEHRERIRWRDVDAYGHVNNAVYLNYLEECRDRWVHDVLGGAFAFVVVRVAIDYRRELSLDDEEIVITCHGVGYGTSSIRTEERIVTRDGALAAESASVVVKHDEQARRSLPLSSGEREALDRSIEADVASG
jgi:acyl-CoA thioester hydrolase